MHRKWKECNNRQAIFKFQIEHIEGGKFFRVRGLAINDMLLEGKIRFSDCMT